MTGIQLAAELRQLRPGLPVLLGTGYAKRAELLGSGLPLLSKPFSQTELVAATEACFMAISRSGRTVVPFRTPEGRTQS